MHLLVSLFLLFYYFISPFIDIYIYKKLMIFIYIFLVAIHVPISIFTGIITSLYRSCFKIKELILYSVLLWFL